MLFSNLVFFTIALIVLGFSAYWLVRSLSKIASYLKISEFVLGFILLAVSTSLPELFVGIKSALVQTPALSLGNIIGANILNLTLAIGIPIIIGRHVIVKSQASKKDATYMFLIAILPIVLYIIGNGLSKIDGIILLTLFILYARTVLVEKKDYKKPMKVKMSRRQAVFHTAVFMASLGLLFKSADYVVTYATLISRELGLSEFLIGVFIVSIGTTLPELTVGTLAALTKHYEMAVGDVIGSVIVNSTLILGTVSIIHPIVTDFNLLLASGVFMIIIAYMFSVLLREKNELNWREGIGFLIIYLIFIAYQLFFELGFVVNI